jgi:hypothetical protein
MKQRKILTLVLMLGVASLLLHCLRASRPNPVDEPKVAFTVPQPGNNVVVPLPVSVPGVPLGDGEHTVGPPKVIGNLAVFPVYAAMQDAFGEFTTLEAAIDSGVATVRERGAQAPVPPPAVASKVHAQAPSALPVNNPNPQLVQLAMNDGATVNQLVLENNGDLPILVLAGSVVKGGKQDRQISQDFVVGPKQTVALDAFCVEHGRWSANRQGVNTGGSFKAVKSLAQGDVRAAGQYPRNQGRVWAKVSEVNRAHKKAAATDTLMATLDDEAMAHKRAAVSGEAQNFLKAVPAAGSVVGLAYAVDGKVRGVRWFFNHDVFAKYGETLVNTAVLDALTADASRGPEEPAVSGACEPMQVATFITKIEAGQVEQRDTNAQNINEVREADVGYSSSATLKAPAKGGGKSKAVTKDFLSK